MSKTQSVILNLNQNYSNSKAHDYFQPVSQQIDIGKNAEVSLYNLSLSRKPLFLEANTNSNEVDFVMNFEYFPSHEQKIMANDPNAIVDENDMVVLDNENLYDINDVDFILKPGGYTIDELGNRIVLNVNSVLRQGIDGLDLKKGDGSTDFTIGGVDAVMSFPYSYIYDKDSFYMGLAGRPYTPETAGVRNIDFNDEYLYSAINNCQNLGISEHAESEGTADITTETESNSVLRGKTFIRSNAAISVADYSSSFTRISDSPLFPLLRLDDPHLQNDKFQQTQSFFEFDIHFDQSANSYDVDFVAGFTNTYLQSHWTNSNSPEVSACTPTGDDLPNVLLGARFVESKQSNTKSESRIDIYCPKTLNEYFNYISGNDDLNDMFNEGHQRLAVINLTEGDIGNGGLSRQGKYGFRFIAHTNQAGAYHKLMKQQSNSNDADEPYYDRVYSFEFYARPTGETDHKLYDSVNDNIYFPGNLIETGWLFNSVISERLDTERVGLGFMPYMFVKELPANAGISNPRGNFIIQKDFINNKVGFRVGVDYYNYKIKNTSLNKILGLQAEAENITAYAKENRFKVFFGQDETDFRYVRYNGLKRFDANAYPEYKADAGLVKLYADNTQYNIELNLPIKAYNTTQPNKKTNNKTFISNLGQKRTIVYKSPPLVQGESQGIDQTFVNLFKEPNNLKYLTLNNSAPLNLNELNVQIRRSKTNELATELEDASIELLIKSE